MRRPAGESSSRRRIWRDPRVALAAGLTLTALGICLVLLSNAPPIVIRSNAPRTDSTSFGASDLAERICQPDEVLPGGTTAIRVWVEAVIGPPVSVEVLSGARLLTQGSRGWGWTAGSVTLPVRRQPRTVSYLTVCVNIAPPREPVGLQGVPSAPALAATVRQGPLPRATPVQAPTYRRGPLPGRLVIEYLRPGDRSWWSLARSVARRMELGHAGSGRWIPVLAIVLLAAVLAVMCWLILGKPARLRRMLVTAWACGVVACLNAGSWSIVTPPFQVPDEPDHVAYVMELAETAHMPTAGVPVEFPDAEINALNGLHQGLVRFKPQFPAVASRAEQDALQHDLSLPYTTGQTVSAGLAASEPPLYYALEAIPYELGSGGTLLDRLQLMRLLSALMAGLTAIFTVLFVRELFPRSPSTWVVGGLGVALTPLLGFVSGGVNPEVMLTAVTAAAFYALARGFRRGLTQQLAIAIGCLVAIGFVTKLNFVGLAPGILLGLILLSVRAVRTSGRVALRWLAISMSIACAPAVLYVLVNLFSRRPGLGIASSAIGARTGSALREVSYIWQLYMPRLPTMKSDFPGIFTTHHLWFDGFVGLYGWVDTLFPHWVYDLALVPTVLIAGLGACALVRKRVQVRRHLTELVVYATIAAGLMVLVGADSYISEGTFWEPRYFLPLVPLLAIVLALATQGAGRRWGPAVGVLIVVMFFAHDVFSQLQVVARYYG